MFEGDKFYLLTLQSCHHLFLFPLVFLPCKTSRWNSSRAVSHFIISQKWSVGWGVLLRVNHQVNKTNHVLLLSSDSGLYSPICGVYHVHVMTLQYFKQKTWHLFGEFQDSVDFILDSFLVAVLKPGGEKVLMNIILWHSSRVVTQWQPTFLHYSQLLFQTFLRSHKKDVTCWCSYKTYWLTPIYAVTLNYGEGRRPRNVGKNRVLQVTKLQLKTDPGRSSTTITH